MVVTGFGRVVVGGDVVVDVVVLVVVDEVRGVLVLLITSVERAPADSDPELAQLTPRVTSIPATTTVTADRNKGTRTIGKGNARAG